MKWWLDSSLVMACGIFLDFLLLLKKFENFLGLSEQLLRDRAGSQCMSFLQSRCKDLKDLMSLGLLVLTAFLLALSFFWHKILTSLSIQGGVSLSLIFFFGKNSLTADQKRSSQ